MTHTGSGGDVASLQQALSAHTTIKDWAQGAELVALLGAAHRAGWLDRLRDGATAADLAGGRDAAVVADALAVLASAGVAESGDDDVFRLTPAFGALLAGGTGIELPATLDAIELAKEQIAAAVDGSAGGLTGAQALTIARNAGVRATPGSRELYGMVFEAVPAYRDALAAGGPLLDLGSGVGGALLTSLALYPRLRAVGVELVPEVAAELRDRAREAGLGDRVEIREADATGLRDEAEFAAAFWAQPFFPDSSRDAVLAVIFRALRPGGLLLLQELVPQQETTTRTLLDRLFDTRRGITYGRSAEDLAVEATGAGFADAEIAMSPLGRLVLARRP
ncbi:SAM-dependent methyltransferase [Amycolatopsis bartoniae]|uniref:Methyltransferase domain-containing protein n=1 Tax=Amycolatopsis bartoniae TaxID=941986 RepID=A0A8H9IUM4_9PSEU|nr:class I SAM-dependent methyltransferase [Amycolatopsis bartoniae]MBB2937812.1 SAM-dependent methyltransferase [Amycolatopsis bartoniae]TVT06521.1 class I SAM-dependent methyltransferase [Amycolatopsis bartoniae]GHF40890.1 hypothetical protein GCM10017566_12900 [Amycolatopsis bartoniae]